MEFFFVAKMGQNAAKGAKKGQKRGKKRVDYRSLLFSLMMFNTLKNK
ncbi:hypothetical protein JSMCR1_2482 [Escherichia coli]|nr:hypothetical protein JSMCR1_2482 [Escherichia coli]